MGNDMNDLINDLKLVMITWCDSNSISQWITPEEIKRTALFQNMKTVGWITHATDELIAISSNAGDNHFSHTTVIPKVAIFNIKELQ